MTKALKLDKRGKLRLSEADVTKQCIDWLQAHGWTAIRRHVGTFTAGSGRLVKLGEKGDPDWLIYCPWEDPGYGYARLFHLELKAKGGRLRKEQRIRHSQLRFDGQLVCVADSLDGLQKWIEEVAGG